MKKCSPSLCKPESSPWEETLCWGTVDWRDCFCWLQITAAIMLPVWVVPVTAGLLMALYRTCKHLFSYSEALSGTVRHLKTASVELQWGSYMKSSKLKYLTKASGIDQWQLKRLRQTQNFYLPYISPQNKKFVYSQQYISFSHQTAFCLKMVTLISYDTHVHMALFTI